MFDFNFAAGNLTWTLLDRTPCYLQLKKLALVSTCQTETMNFHRGIIQAGLIRSLKKPILVCGCINVYQWYFIVLFTINNTFCVNIFRGPVHYHIIIIEQHKITIIGNIELFNYLCANILNFEYYLISNDNFSHRKSYKLWCFNSDEYATPQIQTK